ncbi:MAG: NADH-quinone oxidoreductase subunit C, partial [Leadbetterella sp.]|nr:NADH-quinone oxidoreductase subunit C [Leadbetterella sp.]
MNFSETEHIARILEEELGLRVTCVTEVLQPYIVIRPEDLPGICLYLSRTPDFYFDFLNCITCVDNGPEKGTMDLLYHLSSIPMEHSVILKAIVGRDEQQVPSLAS